MTKYNVFFCLMLLALGALGLRCGGSQTTPVPSATPVGYTEPHRPQFHFSPEKMWTNDPNGMVFYDGEYHLFYQYYPDSTVWGPMHWGHAVSRDLAHWEHLPIALYPDSLGYIFSGSAVVDWHNSSGLGKDSQPPLVAMYTIHDMKAEKAGSKSCESQGIAVSHDRGRTWTKYAGNPVLPNPGGVRDFRDPKIIWHEASAQWVVTLAVGDHTEFWASKNLKNWTRLSAFGKEYGAHGGVWECPDFFPLRVEGSGETKWVLVQNLNPGAPNGGSGTQYFVGDFDGTNFTLDPAFAKTVSGGQAAWLDYGRDNYAGVTWSDVPQADGRRILLGWMSNWNYANVVPTGVWRNAMTLPRALTLKKTADGYRLCSQPVRELETLREKSCELTPAALSPAGLDLTEKLGFSPTLSEMELVFEVPDGASGSFGVELSNSKNERYRIGYDAGSRQFFSDRTGAGDASFSDQFAAKLHTAPRFSGEKTLRLHLFFDVASAELFADDGAAVMTEIFFPSEDFNRARLFAEGGNGPRLVAGKVHRLKRIWK